MTDLSKQLIFEEGLKLDAYRCTAGHKTIGIGHNIDAKPKFHGNPIPDKLESVDQALAILDDDIREAKAGLEKLWPTLSLLPDGPRKDALIQMAFQLGASGVLKFRKMLLAVQRQDWALAYAEALDSEWARVDTPARARRVARQFITNEYYEVPTFNKFHD